MNKPDLQPRSQVAAPVHPMAGARAATASRSDAAEPEASFALLLAGLGQAQALPDDPAQAMNTLLPDGEEEPAQGLLLPQQAATLLSGMPLSDSALSGSPQIGMTQAGMAPAGDTAAMAAAHMPWLGLVAQTRQIDTRSDIDLRQGATSDWLSGRANATLAALRREQGASAHAAFMAPAAGLGAPGLSEDGSVGEGDAGAADTLAGPGLSGPQRSLASGALTGFAAVPDADAPKAVAQSRAAIAAGELQGAEPWRAEAARAHAPQGLDISQMQAVEPEPLLFARSRPGAGPDLGLFSETGALQVAPASPSSGQGGLPSPGQGPAGAGERAQQLAQQVADQISEQISEQMAYWVHGKAQNAALSVGHEGRAIEVQLSLQGQQAHVRFGSDQEQARLWLDQAQLQLRELLQAQGLELAAVSVGPRRGEGGEGEPARGRQEPPGREGLDGERRLGRVSLSRDDSMDTQTGLPGGASPGIDLFV
ncbi:flagellar hook-length control protein FliK [Comamonas composti]|uniref:flagellar hook-length control protein FliK n=1 Tax=Comamonas composti TaxID=408558 RepID=UPI0003FD968D|nr:flagellar hook-length control protein FliK [Comamonas composti]